MTDLLQEEITGRAPTVRIRGTERPLAYPMHAVILYKRLTGDSLFVSGNFSKIDLDVDPDRWLKCLWAGLHVFADQKWCVPFSLEELGALVDFSNAGEISVAMVRAILQSMPKPKEDAAPKAAAPELPQEKLLEPAAVTVHPSLESTGSTPELDGVSVYPSRSF